MDNEDLYADEPVYAVSDGQLLAYLDGLAAPEIPQQIEQSEHLRRQAQALARFQTKLGAHLFRQTCPDAQTLGDYYLEYLDRATSRRTSQHLLHCPHCTRELISLQSFLGKLPTQPGLGQRVQLWVAQFLNPLGSIGDFQPALALRGDAPEPLAFVTEEGVEIALNVHDDGAAPGRKIIVGLINGVESETVIVDLYQEGHYVTTAGADTLGNFMLEGLLPGTYELIVKSATFLIHIQSFTI